MATQYKVTTSTELMDNYKQSELISPQKKFRAVQTDKGLALLFSIGTDNVFYLIEQQTGHQTGWEKIDLSSGLKAAHDDDDIVAKTFAVAQNVKTQKIDLALVITVQGKDFLYLSLGHDNTATSITADTITWTGVPFDDPEHSGIKLDVENVFISESRDEEYIVVDISQSTFTNPTNYIARYYIDNTATQKWNSMTIGGELEPGASSCLGRVSGDRVDGMYTLGTIGGTTELLYAPLYNPFNKGAPVTVRRLAVPTGASVIAVSDAGNEATNLFAAADAGLYYFASDNQEDGAKGVCVVPNKLFDGASSLYAIATSDQVVVWGLNGSSDQIFYTTCPAGKLADSSAWSVPIPIMNGVEQVAPFVNRDNSAKTFFAHTGTGERTIGVKSPNTNIWNKRQVHLPPPNTKVKAIKFRSYTTRIQVTDKNDQPVRGVMVEITSDSDTSVYINHLYHVIGSSPVEIETDALGTITVVDAVETLSGAALHVSLPDGTKSSVNPMDKPTAVATKLQSESDLSGAVITYQNGDTKKLVKDGVKSDALEAVARANKQLVQAYSHVNSGSGGRGRGAALATATASGGEGIWVEAGDLFSWLEHEIEAVGEIIWDAAKDAWTFVVKIAGEIYSAVLDCVEAVVSAVQTVFNAIIAAIEELVDFLKFLFDLEDIKRTKEVIENVAKLFLQHETQQIEVIKQDFNKMISEAEKAINNWAGRGSLSGLGAIGSKAINKTSTPAKDNSAAGHMLSSHFQNNAQNTSMLSKPPTPTKPSDPVTVLLHALEQEWDTLGAAFNAVHKLTENMSNMSPVDFVKQLIAIIADSVLESVKVVADALLDIIYDMAEVALKVFETPIHIPVVSDILEEFGVPEFSFLDIACWVAAIPATIVYKIAEGKAPFADDADTKAITSATSFTALAKLFPGSPSVSLADTSDGGQVMEMAAAEVEESGPISISQRTADAVFVICHGVAGVTGLFSAFLDSIEASEEDGENDWVYPSVASAIVGGGLQVGANFLVPKDPIENAAVKWVYRATGTVRGVCKVIFSGPGQKYLEGKAKLDKLNVEDSRGVGAVVDAVLVLPALACTCWHFYELSEGDSDSTRTEAILDEASNCSSYLSRVSYCVAVHTQGEVKAAAIAILAVADLLYGGLQTAEAIV